MDVYSIFSNAVFHSCKLSSCEMFTVLALGTDPTCSYLTLWLACWQRDGCILTTMKPPYTLSDYFRVYTLALRTVKSNLYNNCDAIIRAMESQITVISIVCSIACSGRDQRKHQSSALLTFVKGIYRWPVDSPHTGPVTRKIFPINDAVIICTQWMAMGASNSNYEYHKYQFVSVIGFNVIGWNRLKWMKMDRDNWWYSC